MHLLRLLYDATMSTTHAASHTLSATRHRDLRSGQSLWMNSFGLSVLTEPLDQDVVTGVAVVGAGISGALMAYELLSRGFAVVLLDRRAPMLGSTMASTALLQFEIDVPLCILAQRIGEERAQRAWRRSYAAVQTLTQLVQRERIRCGYGERKSLYLAGTLYDADVLATEVDARRRAGLPGTLMDRAALEHEFEIRRSAGICSEGSAVANPAQLTAGLLRRCVAHGATIYAPADVQSITTGSNSVTLTVPSGATVVASHVVFCTGYELPKMITFGQQTIASTWAIASEPVRSPPTWLASTVVWEASDPYLYLRTTNDGRIVAGGEDEESATRHTDRHALEEKASRIQRRVEALIPGLSFTLSHRWAGAFGSSLTGLPLIDAIPDAPRCYSVTGFGGNGITHSVIASQIVGAAIDGEQDPDADLFRLPS